jgi:hypothetical protein
VTPLQFLQQQPIIVRVVETPVKETSLSDVVFGAIGLVGVLLVAAALLGAVLGGVLILYHTWRVRTGRDKGPDPDELRVTPTGLPSSRRSP